MLPAADVPRAGLVGEWLFAGDTRDTSGNGFDGKVSGGAVAAPDRLGRPGMALSFNGTNAKLDCGPLPGAKLTQEATISLWVKLEGKPGYWHIAGKAGGGTDLDLIVDHGAARFYIAGGANYSTRRKLTEGVWTHLAASFRAGGKLKIYLDGQLDGAIDIGGRGENGNPFTLGESGAWPGRWFKGVLDEVRLYDRQLSDAEVAALAADKSAAPPTLTSGDRGATLARQPDARGPVLIKAYIDGRSRLLIRDDQAWWQHFEFDLPGKNGGNDFPTRVGDREWKPSWREVNGRRESVPQEIGAVFSPGAGPVTLNRRTGRGSATIVQQPDPANGHALIIEFNDPEPFADWYEVGLEQKGGGVTAAPKPAGAGTPTSARNPPSVADRPGQASAASRSADFSPSPALPPAARSNFDQGQVWLAAGNYRAAIEAYTSAIGQAPDFAAAYRERGRAQSRLKDFRAAAEDLSAAIRLDSRDAVAFNLRGNARSQLGDAGGAIADYSRAIELDPKYPSALANRGALRVAAGDYTGARQDYDSALAIAPEDVNALWGRGTLKARTGDPTGAVADYDRALGASPKNAGILTNRGQALYQMGKYAEAMISLNRALEIEPRNANALTNRGLTKAKLGDVPGAETDIKFALATDPQHPAAQTALAEVQRPQRPAAEAAVAVSTPARSSPNPAAAPATDSAPSPNLTVSQSPATSSGRPANETGPEPPLAVRNALPPLPPVPRPHFRLVKIEMPPAVNENERWRLAEGRYDGQGTNAGITHQWGAVWRSLHWQVPSVIVPGAPSKFRLTYAVSDRIEVGGGAIMELGFTNSDDPFRVDATVAYNYQLLRTYFGARLAEGQGYYPDLPNDEVDFVLPDFDRAPLVNSEGLRTVTLPLRNFWSQEGPHIRPPREEKLSRYNGYEGQDLVIQINWSVGEIAPLIAVYIYRWTPAASGAVADTSALELQTDPAGRTELRADGHDGVLLKARVKPKDATPAAAAAALTATQAIRFSADGESGRWLDFSVAEMRDGWKVVSVKATNPDAARSFVARPPPAFTVTASAQDGDRPLMKQITLHVPPEPVLGVVPDQVEFSAQSGSVAEVKAAIETPGPDPWTFRAEFAARNRSIATFDLRPVDGKSATLTLKEAGLDPLHDGTNDERSVLRLFAEQTGRAPLEREIKVAVVQEGLFVSNTGRDPNENFFRLRGDGSGRSTEIDFRVFALDPPTRKIVNLTRRAEVLRIINVECLEPKGSIAANVLEVGQLAQVLAGVRSVNEAAGILRLTLPKEVPADGRIIPCDFRISYRGRNEEAFTAIITVGVVTTAAGPGGRDWQVELARCQEIINKFVPAAYYPKMQAMLDQRKMTLGAEGLHLLRQKIWSAAMELTLAEGGRGYADEAKWAGAISDALEWAQWAGDMAFGAVIGTMTGPYGALGASSLKTAIISALNAYQDGRGVDEWLWENLCTIPGILEGKIVDVDTFERLGVESKAKAWALFISYHFLKNLYQDPNHSVITALTNTAKAVGSDVLSTWLSTEVKRSGNVAVSTWAGQKVQDLGEAARAVVTTAPGQPTVEPAARTAAAEPPPAAKSPTKTTAETSTPKTLETPPAATSGSNAASRSATAKLPDTPTTAPKAGPESATEAPPSTKVAADDPATKASAKTASAEVSPATKTGSAAEARVAKTDDSRAGTKQGATDATAKAPTKAKAPVESNASGRVRSRMSIVGGKPYANPDDVLAIMRDPSMVRALKNAPPQVQEAFSNTREAIYRQHDAAVVQHVKDSVPDMKNRFVKVMEFRTPGATGPSLNTDRDYRVVYWAGKDRNTGKDIWVEVDRRHWEKQSYQTFARLTGGPADDPEAATHWAEAHQQLGTDKFHMEASPDFSDQKTVWNPQTRQFERVQVKPNILRVKEGQPGASLVDPKALGQMYEVKVGDAKFPHEKFVQAKKAVEELSAVRKGYTMQGRGERLGELPQPVVNGMRAVLTVNTELAADPNRRNPKAIAEAEKTLRENGFRDLRDFMNKLSSQFESLKLAN